MKKRDLAKGVRSGLIYGSRRKLDALEYSTRFHANFFATGHFGQCT